MINRTDFSGIAITGIGSVTPLGNDPGGILAAVRRGDTADAPPTRFDPSPFDCRVAAEVRGFAPEAIFGENKALRLMNQDALHAVAAARGAMIDSGVAIGRDYAPDEVGLFGATGMAGIALDEVAPLITFSTDREGFFDPRLFGSAALHKVRPTLSFKILSNMPVCFVSIFENLMGENAIFNPWESQGARAIRQGAAAIVAGRVAAALVGGCDVKAHELGFIALQQQGLFGDWRREGCGLVPGEGAAFLFLERADLAQRRGARIHALLESALEIDASSPSGPASVEDVSECLLAAASEGGRPGTSPVGMAVRASVRPNVTLRSPRGWRTKTSSIRVCMWEISSPPWLRSRSPWALFSRGRMRAGVRCWRPMRDSGERRGDSSCEAPCCTRVCLFLSKPFPSGFRQGFLLTPHRKPAFRARPVRPSIHRLPWLRIRLPPCRLLPRIRPSTCRRKAAQAPAFPWQPPGNPDGGSW